MGGNDNYYFLVLLIWWEWLLYCDMWSFMKSYKHLKGVKHRHVPICISIVLISSHYDENPPAIHTEGVTEKGYKGRKEGRSGCKLHSWQWISFKASSSLPGIYIYTLFGLQYTLLICKSLQLVLFKNVFTKMYFEFEKYFFCYFSSTFLYSFRI